MAGFPSAEERSHLQSELRSPSAGFGIKVALLFHLWTPDVYEGALASLGVLGFVTVLLREPATPTL
jgi:hypothetical protein